MFAFEEATLRGVPVVAVCALADSPDALDSVSRMEDGFSRLMTPQEKEHP